MWPVTLFQIPKYKESFTITITDKISALNSFHSYYKKRLINSKIYKYAYIFLVSFVFKLF